MRRDSRAWLWDVRDAAESIEEFVAGKDLQVYTSTKMLHSAVERKFEIIGEALGQLSKADPVLADRIPDARGIIAFRNLLIHGYAAIEHPRVWRTIQESLPPLRRKVAEILEELGPLR